MAELYVQTVQGAGTSIVLYVGIEIKNTERNEKFGSDRTGSDRTGSDR